MTSSTIELPATPFTPADADSAGRSRTGIRLELSSRAPAFLRMHLARASVRVALSMAVDAVTLTLVWFGRVVFSRPGPGAVGLWEFVVATIVGLALLGCYGGSDQRHRSGALGRAAGVGAVLAFWARLWIHPIAVLPALAGLWLVTAVALIAARRLARRLARLLPRAHGHVTRAVVIGSAAQAVELIDHPALGETPWCHLDAFFDPADRTDQQMCTELGHLIRTHRIDTVIIADRLDTRVFSLVLDAAITAGCQVLSFPRVAPTPTVCPQLVWREGAPVVEITRPGMIGSRLVLKRLIDIVGAGAALILLAPVFAAIAWLIRLQSDGPVFFRQTRVGQGGRPFRIVKFRTMCANAEAQCNALAAQSVYQDRRLFKMPTDPRVTALGAVLRRTSLDELPQFWNVLVGDMSLVGPRPPMPGEVALYEAKDYARFDVKPGLTGPWQVSGRSAIHDFDEVVRLETSYIRRWNLWLDFTLLLRTVPAVLSGRGAH